MVFEFSSEDTTKIDLPSKKSEIEKINEEKLINQAKDLIIDLEELGLQTKFSETFRRELNRYKKELADSFSYPRSDDILEMRWLDGVNIKDLTEKIEEAKELIDGANIIIENQKN